MQTISIIGAGNLSTRLSLGLLEVGYEINYIYNRTEQKGEKLIKILSKKAAETKYSKNIEDTFSSDIVILAISDDAIEEMAAAIKDTLLRTKLESKPIFLHTSGATPISALSPIREAGALCGVLYPLMTFTYSKDIDLSITPFLIEGDDPNVENAIASIVSSFDAEYSICDSQRRLRFHIAAVFACNFTNYLLGLAFDITEREQTYLLPITIEMIRKSFLISPTAAQTGPAVRGDIKTMEKHIELLEKLNLSEHKEIYEIISKNIINKKNNV